MKEKILEFVQRGLSACGLGPIVLAIVYLVLQQKDSLGLLTVNEVCTGIFSLTALAFIVGGMGVIYQIERLPLMVAILIHGCVLFASYLITYLVNGWLKSERIPVMMFTVIFVLGYLLIWVFIYIANRKNTARVNEKLKQKQ